MSYMNRFFASLLRAASIRNAVSRNPSRSLSHYVPKEHGFRPEKYGPAFTTLQEKYGLRTYGDFHRFSLEQNDTFWETLARSTLQWSTPFNTVKNCDFSKGHLSWFLGGKLNISENCLDRHVKLHPNKTAIIWEKDEPKSSEQVSYRELLDLTCKLANALKAHGVRKGDRVCIYLPTSTMAAVSMLACARIGAVHSLVFAGFSAESLKDRINDCSAKVVITANESRRGGKVIPLQKIVDQAIQDCPSVEKILVHHRDDVKPDGLKGKYVDLNKAMEEASDICNPEIMESEDPLFLLYTSGSTGKPKGILHTQAGYALYVAVTHKVVFDYRKNDIFGCMADVGWITGHSYGVYGPLLNGGTTVLFESTPLYKTPGRYWDTIEQHRVNQVYLSPTALRLLLRYGEQFVKNHDLSSVRTLGVVGEPCNIEAWEWYFKTVGEERCPIVDTYWQTETGGIVMAPLPADADEPIYPSFAMRPFFGIDPVLKNSEDHGEGLTSGALCFNRPWPGIARGVYGNQQRFRDAYFSQVPGTYFTGDGSILTKEGCFRITGRIDDVINISGHRLGTAEVEDVIDSHESVAEAAVISFPDAVKGEALAAFVVLREDHSHDDAVQVIKELKTMIRSKIAPYAVPNHIVVCGGLPKTRSGKIMRRMLKKVARNEKSDFGDTSTLSDPDSLSNVIKAWEIMVPGTEDKKVATQA